MTSPLAPVDGNRRRRRGRRRTDLPAWATVLLAAIAALETLALAWLASS